MSRRLPFVYNFNFQAMSREPSIRSSMRDVCTVDWPGDLRQRYMRLVTEFQFKFLVWDKNFEKGSPLVVF